MKLFIFFLTSFILSFIVKAENKSFLRSSATPAEYEEIFDKNNRLYLDHKNITSIYKGKLRKNEAETGITWRNLVFVILSYNEDKANLLLQGQFETWMKRVGEGLDIVLVVDEDDVRSYEEIIPRNGPSKAKIHLLRSSAPKEGKKARSKVIDAFKYVKENFLKVYDKKYFLKIDPDSYVITERLIDHINEINKLTDPLPVDFGSCLCNTPICYSIGGLYGLSRKSLELMVDYVENNPQIYELRIYPEKKEDVINAMQHEDFFTSYVSWKASGYPVICSKEISVRFSKPSFANHHKITSIHPVKSYEEFQVIHKIFYDYAGLSQESSLEHKHKRYLNYIQHQI